MKVLTNTTVTIILQYICTICYHTVHLNFTQCYMTIYINKTGKYEIIPFTHKIFQCIQEYRSFHKTLAISIYLI